MGSIVMTSGMGLDGYESGTLRVWDRDGIGVALFFSLFFFGVKVSLSPSLRGTFINMSWDAIIDPSSSIGGPADLVGMSVTLTGGGSSHA